MRRVASTLFALGIAVGAVDAAAIFLHLGIAGAPWLVNVALAKLGFVAALGLLGGGAVAGRLARRADERRLGAGDVPL
jgi:hypothetical protein